MQCIEIDTKTDMEKLGFKKSNLAIPGTVMFFNGEIGSGKTTLIKGFLMGLGYKGTVCSPTYTLVEPYVLNKISVFHLDLYRLRNLNELEMIGIRDMMTSDSICFIEWSNHGNGLLPQPNYEIEIQYKGTGRTVFINTFLQ